MKLEVGMYVRFDYHRISVPIQIGKITEEHYDELCGYCYSTDIGLVIGEDNLVKEPSHNIKDIIEYDDVLKIIYQNTEYISKVVNVLGNKGVQLTQELSVSLGCVDIKSIVTKEQFERMSYKVGK